MFDERLLARALPRPAQDASSRALDEVMHLAQSAKYELAAERAAELLDAGCKDIRPFVVYALGVFAERGPAAVPALFGSITGVLSAQARDSAASSSGQRTTDTALRFGFRIMRAHLDFDERRPEAERQAWVERLVPDSAGAVQRACSELREAIHAIIAAPLCEGELGAVVARLETYCSRHAPEKRAERPSARGEVPVEPQATPMAPSETALASSPHDAPLPEARRAAQSFARRASDYEEDRAPALAVSPALRQFILKLEAFERLISSGSFAKAAIVAHDVRNVIAAFDPMIYLPDLLAPHFRLLSGTADELSQYGEQSATPGWQALEQLYRVDLEAFVEA
jgi:hypothetical protein